MSQPHLILGNARYSSWSMRPYIVLKRAGIAFTTEFLPLRTDEFRSRMPRVSPFATVPVLKLGDVVIGDSLAISEWVAEQKAGLWPKDEMLRAKARTLTAQMHGGFMALRRECPMDLFYRADPPMVPSEDVMKDISKLSSAWGQALESSGGPFLFGDWSIADAFYTPVASRFQSYGTALPEPLQSYVEHLLEQPEFLAWQAIAKEENWVIEDYN